MAGTDGHRGESRSSDARDLLTVAAALRRAVRSRRRQPARVALGVTGLLFAAAGVVYRFFPPARLQLVPGSGGGYRVPRGDALANLGGQPPDRAAAVFWLVSVPLAWAACGWAFHRRRTDGLGRRPLGTAAIGLAPFALLVLAELVVAPHVAGVHAFVDNPAWPALPALAVAAGMALLAGVDRDRSLGVTAVVVAVGPVWIWLHATRLSGWMTRLRELAFTQPSLTLWGAALVAAAAVLWSLDRRAGRTPT